MTPSEFKERLKRLPVKYRVAVERYCGDRETAINLAAEFGITPDAVYKRLREAARIIGHPLPHHTLRGRPKTRTPAPAQQ